MEKRYDRKLLKSDEGAVSVETILIVIGLVAIAGAIIIGIRQFADDKVDELNSQRQIVVEYAGM